MILVSVFFADFILSREVSAIFQCFNSEFKQFSFGIFFIFRVLGSKLFQEAYSKLKEF